MAIDDGVVIDTGFIRHVDTSVSKEGEVGCTRELAAKVLNVNADDLHHKWFNISHEGDDQKWLHVIGMVK